jgi:hypothetical protein
MDAPKEKRHRPGKVHKGHGEIHRPAPFASCGAQDRVDGRMRITACGQPRSALVAAAWYRTHCAAMTGGHVGQASGLWKQAKISKCHAQTANRKTRIRLNSAQHNRRRSRTTWSSAATGRPTKSTAALGGFPMATTPLGVLSRLAPSQRGWWQGISSLRVGPRSFCGLTKLSEHHSD